MNEHVVDVVLDEHFVCKKPYGSIVYFSLFSVMDLPGLKVWHILPQVFWIWLLQYAIDSIFSGIRLP